MDAEYVHRQDVVTILTQFQSDIEKEEKRLADHESNEEEFGKKVEELIVDADRSLRLKTQAIVRCRLSQSRTLPVRCSTAAGIRRPALQGKPQEAKLDISAPASILHKAIPRLGASATSRPSASRTTARTSAPSRAVTAQKPTRRMMGVPTIARHDLPFYDYHDPQLSPKPLPENAIENYGLEQLIDSRLLRSEEASKALDGTLHVSKFTGDINFSRMPHEDQWVMDTNVGETMIVREGMEHLRPKTSEHVERAKTSEDTRKKWIFPLILGRPSESSAVYVAFQQYFSNRWEEVETVLESLRGICEAKGLKNENVDGAIIADLSKLDPDERPREKLLQCFVRRGARVAPNNSKIGFGFIGPLAEQKAATAIQSVWRGFWARRLLRNIRRNAAAARIIQRWFRNARNLKHFRQAMQAEFKRRYVMYENNPLYKIWKPDMNYIVLHLIEGHSGSEIGRLASLHNENVSLIFFTRTLFGVAQAQFARSLVPNSDRIQFVCAQQRLPTSLPIEDVLACDNRALNKIKQIAGSQLIVIQPNSLRQSLVDLTAKLSALVIAPTFTRMTMLQTYESHRRFMQAAKLPLFEASDEVYDKMSLCKALTDLSISYLAIQQWRIRVNNTYVGWVNTNDFVLLEKLRSHSDVLTENDLEDGTFRDLLIQTLSKDMDKIVETTGTAQRSDVLADVWMNGVYLIAGPRQVKSSPCVSVKVMPDGTSKITGTWETLYSSMYEPFASIHPAFLADPVKLKKHGERFAAEAGNRNLLGVNVMKFWYSTRTKFNSIDESKTKMKLTADELFISSYEHVRAQQLVELACKRTFDDETLTLGPSMYVYVQEQFVCPDEVDFEYIRVVLHQFAVPIEDKVFFFHDLKDPTTFSLVVMEETPEKLITLVHRIVLTIAEQVFKPSRGSRSLLPTYVHALSFLKTQLDISGSLESTVLMRKVKRRDLAIKREERFMTLNMDDVQTGRSSGGATNRSEAPTSRDTGTSRVTGRSTVRSPVTPSELPSQRSSVVSSRGTRR